MHQMRSMLINEMRWPWTISHMQASSHWTGNVLVVLLQTVALISSSCTFSRSQPTWNRASYTPPCVKNFKWSISTGKDVLESFPLHNAVVPMGADAATDT